MKTLESAFPRTMPERQVRQAINRWAERSGQLRPRIWGWAWLIAVPLLLGWEITRSHVQSWFDD